METSSGSLHPEMALPAPAPVSVRSRHYPALDSLRGLAAVVVVFSHYILLWDPSSVGHGTRLLLDGVLVPFFNGRSSVILFFLLSGFVLSLPYKRGNALPYHIFFLRRLARIYVPYVAALALALVADWRFHGPLPMSRWSNLTWTAPLTWPLILQNFLLIGNYDTAQVNTAFWSLAVEMRLSILFPLLCLPLLRLKRSYTFLLFAALVVFNIAAVQIFAHRMRPVSFTNMAEMIAGTVAFAAGILLSRWLELFQTTWGRTPALQRILFFAISLTTLEWSANLPVPHAWIFADVLPVAGGCGVLIATLCSRRVTRILSHRLPAWLGRVSYSLYLVHATVLFSLMHLFFARATRLELLAPYLLLSLLSATAFFFLVEKPCIHLSRTIGRSGRTLSKQPV
ncbi:acyltransferase family protein [Granulicella sibirica]|uniref:acyltransferase family protein n=1 Tax=Granulicella sibirica TaxID=2479048 RepID=UPI00100899C9|nr:acyltransferase [Granulicella sibirica]